MTRDAFTLSLFDFDDAPAPAPQVVRAASLAPAGWTFAKHSQERCTWSWAPDKRPPHLPRTIEITIEYSPYGWMWGVSYWTGNAGGGYGAQEKWKNFAWSPAEALMAAASELAANGNRHTEDAPYKAMMAAAEKLRQWVTHGDDADFDESRFPLKFLSMAEAVASPPPTGYCKVIFAGSAGSASLVLWQEAGKWYRHRPGVPHLGTGQEGEFVNPTPPERWPGAIVHAICQPVLPAMSGQFAEWGSAT